MTDKTTLLLTQALGTIFGGVVLFLIIYVVTQKTYLCRNGYEEVVTKDTRGFGAKQCSVILYK